MINIDVFDINLSVIYRCYIRLLLNTVEDLKAMKLTYVALLSITALLTVSCTPQVNSKVKPTQPETVKTPPAKLAPSLKLAPRAFGIFASEERRTLGSVSVVTENGRSYLEFSDAFKTEQGPELFVVLHRSTLPKSYKASDYVSLGPLQKLQGTQRYPIPDRVDLGEFYAVAIWSRKLNSTFGYAALS